MSTASDRLEAEVWLETSGPDLAACQRDAFFVAVDEYYQVYPTADRGSDFLATLREDDEAFSLILNEILSGDSEDAASSTAEAAIRR